MPSQRIPSPIRHTFLALAWTTAALSAMLAAKIGDRTAADPAEKEHPAQSAAGAPITMTGPPIAIAHGVVQVRITVAGKRLLTVAAIRLPHDNPDSWIRSLRAAVLLGTEAIQTQSAHIDAVSGATYTSLAYAESLQAALDEAALDEAALDEAALDEIAPGQINSISLPRSSTVAS